MVDYELKSVDKAVERQQSVDVTQTQKKMLGPTLVVRLKLKMCLK